MLYQSSEKNLELSVLFQITAYVVFMFLLLKKSQITRFGLRLVALFFIKLYNEIWQNCLKICNQIQFINLEIYDISKFCRQCQSYFISVN